MQNEKGICVIKNRENEKQFQSTWFRKVKNHEKKLHVKRVEIWRETIIPRWKYILPSSSSLLSHHEARSRMREMNYFSLFKACYQQNSILNQLFSTHLYWIEFYFSWFLFWPKLYMFQYVIILYNYYMFLPDRIKICFNSYYIVLYFSDYNLNLSKYTFDYIMHTPLLYKYTWLLHVQRTLSFKFLYSLFESS